MTCALDCEKSQHYCVRAMQLSAAGGLIRLLKMSCSKTAWTSPVRSSLIAHQIPRNERFRKTEKVFFFTCVATLPRV